MNLMRTFLAGKKTNSVGVAMGLYLLLNWGAIDMAVVSALLGTMGVTIHAAVARNGKHKLKGKG